MSPGLRRATGVLLITLAVLVGLAGIGWVVFAQFINHPQSSPSGELTDMLGRTVTPAPWFVRTFLPFLTDSVASPPDREAATTVLAPFAPGQYWVGWAWSIFDWLGMVLALTAAYGLFAAGEWVRRAGSAELV